MTKLGIDVSQSMGCRKPKCTSGQTHRHHKGNEFLFIKKWTPSKGSDHRFQKFAARYWSYNKKDTEDICPSHHAEIHLIYDKIIIEYCNLKKKPTEEFTWEEAIALIEMCKKRFSSWIKEETPGVDPSLRLGPSDIRCAVCGTQRQFHHRSKHPFQQGK